jgi:predicted DNA-binding protein (MmcQ/YjbR family)
MNVESFISYCSSLEGITEEFPFGPQTLVYKVNGKIFAIAGLEEFSRISLKCDPELAIELRERYPGVIPGYHLNKKHWNTVLMDHSIPDKLIREWIYHSYELVKGKPAKKKAAAKKTAKKKTVKKKK